MARIVRLTERDLTRLVKRVIQESNPTYGAQVVGSKINFIIQKTNKKMLGTIEKIYNPSKSGIKSPYSQILVVNFGNDGRHEIGFNCKDASMYCPSLDSTVYTEAGLEERLQGNWCK